MGCGRRDAAFKAVAEVTDIGSLLLRVGSYAAVGMFLLGADIFTAMRAWWRRACPVSVTVQCRHHSRARSVAGAQTG